MSEPPLVSVCIPSYNGEQFIAATLQSVLAQTFKNFELIVVDDCSSDATVHVIQSFSDPRIKLIKNERNLGLGANWNKVLSRATGKYVKLMGGDDVLAPECLSRQVAVLQLQANSDIVLAICNRNVINPEGEIVLRRKFPFRAGRVAGNKLIRASVGSGSNLLGEPVVALFRREALPRVAKCDAANPYLVDLALWAELLRTGNVFVDPDYLASFRISGETASASIGRSQAAYFRSFVRRIRAENAHGVTWFDALLGSALSYPWCIARNSFMSMCIRRSLRRKQNQQDAAAKCIQPEEKPSCRAAA